jgi:diguanylate cyclase (GGDEF)-like protein
MNKLGNYFLSIGEKITEPHPSITDERKRLEAKVISFMVLVMIVGVALNLLLGTGLTISTLIALCFGYGFSRSKYYSAATYLIIIILLVTMIWSLFASGEFDRYSVFTHVAWLCLSLVFASLLLSIKETILISVAHLIILYLISVFTPEITLKAIGVSFGFLLIFSFLLIITMWQRNVLEAARQEKIRLQATYDLVTGLPNRILFHDRLDQALARIERKKSVGSILYLDLDNFKEVNDEFSHEIGDQVLKEISERILSCIRITDTGARISGDEFGILLEDVSGPENVAILAEKILDTISKPIRIRNSEAIITGSIGIAMIPKDGMENAGLLQNADTAMYGAKADGKNSISFFTIEMKEKMLKSIALSKNMIMAFENQEIHLEYQPQYDTCTGKAFGAEALLRWDDPQEGIISPRKFIPIAEKNGMIIPMGERVIMDVISLHQTMSASFLPNIRIAINLSGRQIRDIHFLKNLTETISVAGFDPSLLEFEITETCIFENLDQALSALKSIKSLGVRLAIDDFGTGYSSLSYLEKFPMDTVKIDISFIHEITDLNVKLPILTGIISIATDMGLDVIAEGVENETQLNFLKNAGCHLVQGFYYNQSLGKDDFLQLLKFNSETFIQ